MPPVPGVVLMVQESVTLTVAVEDLVTAWVVVEARTIPLIIVHNNKRPAVL